MRLIAYILSFHILLLALEPVMNVIDFGEDKTECCGGSCKPIPIQKSQSEQQPVKKDSGIQTVCNPFAICNGCTGWTIVYTFILSIPEIYHKGQYTPVTVNLPSKIDFDFWQPPKIA